MGTHRHHLQPKELGGTDLDANIIHLCPNHHFLITAAIDAMSGSGLADVFTREGTLRALEHFERTVEICEIGDLNKEPAVA